MVLRVPTERGAGPAVRFEAVPLAIDGATIVRLPQPASRQLPSRGQVAARGTINGRPFDTVIEPDGEFGHWMRLDAELQDVASRRPGAPVAVELAPRPDWPEPEVPDDLRAVLDAAPPTIQELWREITPMARWEWVRWVNATRNPNTRRRRVEVAISKLQNGKRRPCCFNLAGCTDPDLSRGGKLRTS